MGVVLENANSEKIFFSCRGCVEEVEDGTGEGAKRMEGRISLATKSDWLLNFIRVFLEAIFNSILTMCIWIGSGEN